jgi:hypothetical protein
MTLLFDPRDHDDTMADVLSREVRRALINVSLKIGAMVILRGLIDF